MRRTYCPWPSQEKKVPLGPELLTVAPSASKPKLKVERSASACSASRSPQSWKTRSAVTWGNGAAMRLRQGRGIRPERRRGLPKGTRRCADTEHEHGTDASDSNA